MERKRQLGLRQTQGSLLRLEGAALERPTFFRLPGTEWPGARLFKGQPSPAASGGLPRAPACSRPCPQPPRRPGCEQQRPFKARRRSTRDRGQRDMADRTCRTPPPCPLRPLRGSAVLVVSRTSCSHLRIKSRSPLSDAMGLESPFNSALWVRPVETHMKDGWREMAPHPFLR